MFQITSHFNTYLTDSGPNNAISLGLTPWCVMVEGWRKFQISVFAIWSIIFLYKIKRCLQDYLIRYNIKIFFSPNRENWDLKFASPCQPDAWRRMTWHYFVHYRSTIHYLIIIFRGRWEGYLVQKSGILLKYCFVTNLRTFVDKLDQYFEINQF